MIFADINSPLEISSEQSEFKSNRDYMPRQDRRNGRRFAPRRYVAAKAATHNASVLAGAEVREWSLRELFHSPKPARSFRPRARIAGVPTSVSSFSRGRTFALSAAS